MADKYLNDVGLRRVVDWVVSKLGGKSDTTHSHAVATTTASGFLSAVDKINLDTAANMQIGGRNLLLHTGKYVASEIALYGSSQIGYWQYQNLSFICEQSDPFGGTSAIKLTPSVAGAWIGSSITNSLNMPIKTTGNHTFSLWLRADNATTVRISHRENSANTQYEKTVDITTEWKRYSVTYDVVSIPTMHQCYFVSEGTVPIYTAFWKTEKGNIATDWSPAPEDINGQITTLTDNYNLVSNTLATHTQEINNIDTELENKADVYWATDKFELYRTLEGNIIQLGLKSDNKVEYAPNVPLNYVRVYCSVAGLSLTLNVCSKNMIPYDSTWIRSGNVSGTWKGFDYTYNGITYTLNGNGKITINGTATANSTLYFAKSVDLPKGTFTASGCTGGSNTTYLIQMGTGDWSTGFGVPSGWATKTLTTSKVLSQCRILVYAGTTVNNVIITPQLEYGSTKSGFEPYTGRTYPVVASGIGYLVNGEVRTTNISPCNIWVSDPADPTIEVCYNRSNRQLSMLQRQIDVLSYAIAALGGE